jgi:hypothetical protein
MTLYTAMILTLLLILAACISGPKHTEKTIGKFGGPTSIRLNPSDGRIRISSQFLSHKTTCQNCDIDLELIVPAGTNINLTMVNETTNFTQTRSGVNASAVHGDDTNGQVTRSFPIRILKGFAGSLWKHLKTVLIKDHSGQIDPPETTARSKVAASSAEDLHGTR